MMARAITAGELTKLRSDGQNTELYLAIHAPATVYTARVNQTFASQDEVIEITYDGGTGTYTDILPGMTLWIGSAAGLNDLGVARIRKAATATVLYIGATSDVAWADNLYLTVVDEFALWTKRTKTFSNESMWMDEEIVYSDQHTTCAPVPVLGPPAVGWLAAGSVSIAFDASASWVPGSTITGYSWACAGGTITGGTTATPSIAFTAAGTYRVSCTVTAASGATAVGYRYVFVYDDAHLPVSQFELTRCEGSYDAGGWTFDIRLFDSAQAGPTVLRSGALVILFAKDRYSGTVESIGPVSGRENIISLGWVEGESIEQDPEQGTVNFSVLGPAAWMKLLPCQPVFCHDTTAAPTLWTRFLGLTLDKFLWHILVWRSTASAVMDVTLTGDTRMTAELAAESGMLWESLSAVADNRMLAHPLCDRYGRLFVAVDDQLTPVADRASFPVVMALSKADFTRPIEIEREPFARVAMLEMMGVYWDGTAANTVSYFARSAGSAAKRFGSLETRSNLMILSQAQLNELTGLYLGWKNSEYPSLRINLAANNRMIDIAPRQLVTLSIDAADTPRGIVWSSKRLIARSVSYRYDSQTGALTADLGLEAETTAELAVAYLKPPVPGSNKPQKRNNPAYTPVSPLPKWPGGTAPGWVPPTLPPGTGGTCALDAATNGPFMLFYGGSADQYQRYNTTLPATLRSASHSNKTRYQIIGRFQKLVGGVWTDTNDDTFYTLNAYDDYGTAIPGTHDALGTNPRIRTGYFAPVGSTNVYSWALDMGAGSWMSAPSSVVVGLGGGGYVINSPGTQVWWPRSGGGLGVKWSGIQVYGYRCTTDLIFTIYPAVGESFDAKTFHIVGNSRFTLPSGRNMTDHHWRVYQGDMTWRTIASTWNGNNADSIMSVDADFSNDWPSVQDILVLTTQAFTYNAAFEIVNISAQFEVYPAVGYRILLDSVTIFNICSR